MSLLFETECVSSIEEPILLQIAVWTGSGYGSMAAHSNGTPHCPTASRHVLLYLIDVCIKACRNGQKSYIAGREVKVI